LSAYLARSAYGTLVNRWFGSNASNVPPAPVWLNQMRRYVFVSPNTPSLSGRVIPATLVSPSCTLNSPPLTGNVTAAAGSPASVPSLAHALAVPFPDRLFTTANLKYPVPLYGAPPTSIVPW
jgi:hypothetical protein